MSSHKDPSIQSAGGGAHVKSDDNAADSLNANPSILSANGRVNSEEAENNDERILLCADIRTDGLQ